MRARKRFHKLFREVKNVEKTVTIKDVARKANVSISTVSRVLNNSGYTSASVKEKVKGMNDFLVPMNTSLKFTMHDELQEYFVQIVDEATNEVIREIPPKKFLDMYAAMAEFMGLFVDEKR